MLYDYVFVGVIEPMVLIDNLHYLNGILHVGNSEK